MLHHQSAKKQRAELCQNLRTPACVVITKTSMCGHKKVCQNLHFWEKASFEPLRKDVVPVRNALAGSMKRMVGSSRQEVLYIPNDMKSPRNADADDAGHYLTTMTE